jgi:6,7-dimethyl-8-ribityllumazine synthase
MQSGRPEEAPLSARGLRVGVVAARFNAEVAEGLLGGALDCLRELGAEENQLKVVRVPGAFELPLAAQWLCQRGDVDAVVALGAVVKGETSHHVHLGREVLGALLRVSERTGIPVACGLITAETESQAKERSRRGHPDNRGAQAARAAVEMAQRGRDLRR